MAKRKKSNYKKVKPKKRVNTMARKKRRRRSTSVRRTLSASPSRRRRRKSGLSAIGKSGFMMALKHNAAGAIGGAGLLLLKLFPMPLWARTAAGYAGAVGLSMANAPFVGAGLAGATTFNLGTSLFGGMLQDDGDMQDAEYVDASTLSDTGMCDENGNTILQDSDGVAYALNEDNELEAVGDAYALQDSMQSVAMLPLQDPYALSNAYALN